MDNCPQTQPHTTLCHFPQQYSVAASQQSSGPVEESQEKCQGGSPQGGWPIAVRSWRHVLSCVAYPTVGHGFVSDGPERFCTITLAPSICSEVLNRCGHRAGIDTERLACWA